MPPSKNCGPHTELAANDAVRITRCACGTVHLTLLGSGVTVRMNAEHLKGLSAGTRSALERLEQAPSHLGSTSIN